jgi:hypothetical protein
MSWEQTDERALSLEEVFLSLEFGQVQHEPPVVEPVAPRAP